MGNESKQEVEEHLIRALQSPVDKLSSKDDWLISSQFLSNYYLSPKAYNSLSVIGMSINIEHSEGVSWRRISKKVPNLHVVSCCRLPMLPPVIHSFRFSYSEEMLSNKLSQVTSHLSLFPLKFDPLQVIVAVFCTNSVGCQILEPILPKALLVLKICQKKSIGLSQILQTI